MQVALRTLVVVGVGMIVGDGVLTPSISVLSSIEGLAVAAPGNASLQKGQRARCAALARAAG
jgi:K+ transporter